MMATALVHNGAHVLIASRKEKQLKEVSERLTKEGPGRCEYIIADVSAKEGCVKLVEDVKKRTDKLNILVNNTGTTWGDKFDLSFDEDKGWKRVFGTNVYAIFYLSAGLATMLEKDATATDPGRIINISSVAGFDRVAGGTGLAGAGNVLHSYNTSKAAANALTQQLAVTLGPRKVTVNAICPGPFFLSFSASSCDGMRRLTREFNQPGVYPSKMTAFGFKQDKDNSLAKSRESGSAVAGV